MLCAVASTVVVWGAATLLLVADVTVPDSPGSASRHALDTPAVLVTACARALAGWALLEVLERWTRRARGVWTAVRVGVFVPSLPYLPGYTWQERLVLVLLHGALATSLVLGLRGPGRLGPWRTRAWRISGSRPARTGGWRAGRRAPG